jgi:tetratricopeptide (TPR) repeat protein
MAWHLATTGLTEAPRTCRSRHVTVVALAALLTCPTPGTSQTPPGTFSSAPEAFDLARVPPRPALPEADPDTNNSLAYLRFGIAVLDTTHSPERSAADALYWAARLDPTLSLAYYGRWVAISSSINNWMSQSRVRIRLVTLSSGNQARLDSLRIRAYLLDPLLDDRLEYVAVARRADWIEGGKIFSHDHGNEGLIAYAKGDFARAVSEWGKALKDHPNYVRLRLARAHAFYFLKQSDSTIAEYQRAEEFFARRDSTVTVPVYASREMFFYAIGFVEQSRHNLDAARTAFEHALENNVGLYMGHEHLGEIAFAQHDTAAALREFETAIGIQPDDPVVRMNYAFVLGVAHRPDDAVTQLEECTRLDPDYATPYWVWAQVLDTRGDSAGALRKYREYLDRSADDATHRPGAVERVSALTK